ncbi:MAG: hypothetical protein ACOCZ8_01675 [Bacteroidota bacterium]
MRFVLLILSLHVAVVATAQKHDYVWVFGDSCGLNFNTPDGEPVFFDSGLQSNETAGSFCDSSGKLLVAFNGSAETLSSAGNFRNVPLQYFANADGSAIEYDFPYPVVKQQYSGSLHPPVYVNDTIDFSDSQGIFFLPHTTSPDTVYALFFEFSWPQQVDAAGSFYRFFTIARPPGGAFRVLPSRLIGRENAEYQTKLAVVKHADGESWWIALREWGNKMYEFVRFQDGKILERVTQKGYYNSGPPQGGTTGKVSFNRSGTALLCQLGGGG